MEIERKDQDRDLERLYRLITREVAERRVEYDICDIGATNSAMMLDDAKVIRNDTASPTAIVFGNLIRKVIQRENDAPIAMKISFDYDRAIEELQRQITRRNIDMARTLLANSFGLAYEIEMYRYITENILNRNYSPNFIRYIASATCSVDSSLSGTIPQDFKRILNGYGSKIGINPQSMANLKYRILVTERAGGIPESRVYTLADLRRSGPHGIEWLGIWFQLIYSLGVMEYFQIMHNDLHGKNILLVWTPTPITRYYLYNGIYYKITSNYTVYIFDWDFSYCPALGPNEKLIRRKTCSRFNVCNKFDSRFDLFLTLCASYPYIPREFSVYNDQLADIDWISKFDYLTGDRYEISENVYNKIVRSHQPIIYKSVYDSFGDRIDIPVYRLTFEDFTRILRRPSAYRKIFGDSIVFDVLTFTLTSGYNDDDDDDDDPFMLIPIATHRCRMTTVPRHALTPQKMLNDNVFADLAVSANEVYGNNIYKFPGQSIARSRESVQRPSGRTIKMSEYRDIQREIDTEPAEIDDGTETE